MRMTALVLLDSGSETNLLGKRFLDRLASKGIKLKLRAPSCSVVGAASDVKLNVLGDATLPLVLTDSLSSNIGTHVTFTVTPSYEGELLLGWPLLCDWCVDISGRREGTTITFQRWSQHTFLDVPVPGSHWTEVDSVRVRLISNKSQLAEENPASILLQETRDQILKNELFSTAKEIIEIIRKPMEKLNLLEQKASKKLICLKAILGSPLIQSLDLAIGLPVLVRARDRGLYIIMWIDSREKAAKWKSSDAVSRLTERLVYNRLCLFLKGDTEAERVAQQLSSYWIEAFQSDEVSWRTIRENIPDDVDDSILFPPEAKSSPSVATLTLESIKKDINCRNEGYKSMLSKMLWKYKAVLGDASSARVRDYEHSIHLERSEFKDTAFRRYSPEDIGILEAECKRLLREGFIKEATTGDCPYVSPPLLVPKKDDKGVLTKKRFCIDYRKLNKMTVKDRYNLPTIDSCLMLRKGRVFSKLDLQSAFWQIPIRQSDQRKTGFRVGNKVYVWTRMPFGLTNAPATMQRLIDRCLEEMLGKSAVAYLDDIIIYSDYEHEHAKHIEQVIKRLHQYGLRIYLKKSSIARRLSS